MKTGWPPRHILYFKVKSIASRGAPGVDPVAEGKATTVTPSSPKPPPAAIPPNSLSTTETSSVGLHPQEPARGQVGTAKNAQQVQIAKNATSDARSSELPEPATATARPPPRLNHATDTQTRTVQANPATVGSEVKKKSKTNETHLVCPCGAPPPPGWTLEYHSPKRFRCWPRVCSGAALKRAKKTPGNRLPMDNNLMGGKKTEKKKTNKKKNQKFFRPGHLATKSDARKWRPPRKRRPSLWAHRPPRSSCAMFTPLGLGW